MGSKELLRYEKSPLGGDRIGLEIPSKFRGYPSGSDGVYRIQGDPDCFLFLEEARVPVASLWPAPGPLRGGLLAPGP